MILICMCAGNYENECEEKSSDHFKDVHRLKLMTNFDVYLTSSPEGVRN